MRSSTRLRLIALCVNVERLWKDGFDHDHDHLDHDAFDHDHVVDHDAFDYGHAHAIELSASPIQGSDPYKGFVANTLIDTFQGISIDTFQGISIETFQGISSDTFQGISSDTFQSVPSDTWQSDPTVTFWSVQHSCQCIHYITNIPLLPAIFHIIELINIHNIIYLYPNQHTT